MTRLKVPIIESNLTSLNTASSYNHKFYFCICRSLINKLLFLDLEVFISDDFDIMALVET